MLTSPGLFAVQVATSPARRGPQLRSQLGANIGGDNAAPGDGHLASAPHDEHAPLRAARFVQSLEDAAENMTLPG